MVTIFPPKLKKGDTIGIIAPSSPVTLPESTIKKGFNYLIGKGFKIAESKNLRQKTGYTAGSISERVSDIHDFFKNPNIKCIMSFWGGFNSNQLLNHLDYKLIKDNPKIFIGYSDITALNLAITKKTGLITFYGPGLITFAKPQPFDYTWDYFDKVCTGSSKELKIEPSKTFTNDLYFSRKDNDHRIIQNNPGVKILKDGKAKGKAIAANLQTLLILAGTQYYPNIDNSILFLEEAEDADAKMVDRLLTQCQQMGLFRKTAGVIFGKFMPETGFSDKMLQELLKRIFEGLNIPVIYDANFGHTDPIFTIPNGGECSIGDDRGGIIIYRSVT